MRMRFAGLALMFADRGDLSPKAGNLRSKEKNYIARTGSCSARTRQIPTSRTS